MYVYKAKVLRVVDGDTIDLLIDLGFNAWKKERIRLSGINTPETRTKDLKEKEKGLLAKKRLNNLINSSNKKVLVKTTEKGKYGRYLGNIYVTGYTSDPKAEEFPRSFGHTDFESDSDYYCANDILLIEGHAEEYFGGKR